MKDTYGSNVICQATDKICYTEREAGGIINACKRHEHKQRGIRQKQKPKRKYFCKDCGFWHVTHFNFYLKGDAVIKHKSTIAYALYS